MSLGARVGMFVAIALLSGCGTHRPQTIAGRFVRHDTARTASRPTEAEAKRDAELQASLDREMAKVRELIAAPRPPRTHDAVNVEQSDPELPFEIGDRVANSRRGPAEPAAGGGKAKSSRRLEKENALILKVSPLGRFTLPRPKSDAHPPRSDAIAPSATK